MGDHWTLNLYCAYCDRENEDIYYAPTCDADTFECEFCGKENRIRKKFVAEKDE